MAIRVLHYQMDESETDLVRRAMRDGVRYWDARKWVAELRRDAKVLGFGVVRLLDKNGKEVAWND